MSGFAQPPGYLRFVGHTEPQLVGQYGNTVLAEGPARVLSQQTIGYSYLNGSPASSEAIAHINRQQPVRDDLLNGIQPRRNMFRAAPQQVQYQQVPAVIQQQAQYQEAPPPPRAVMQEQPTVAPVPLGNQDYEFQQQEADEIFSDRSPQKQKTFPKEYEKPVRAQEFLVSENYRPQGRLPLSASGEAFIRPRPPSPPPPAAPPAASSTPAPAQAQAQAPARPPPAQPQPQARPPLSPPGSARLPPAPPAASAPAASAGPQALLPALRTALRLRAPSAASLIPSQAPARPPPSPPQALPAGSQLPAFASTLFTPKRLGAQPQAHPLIIKSSPIKQHDNKDQTITRLKQELDKFKHTKAINDTFNCSSNSVNWDQTFQIIFKDNPDALFDQLLTYISFDISSFISSLSNYRLKIKLILLFIPLLVLFTKDGSSDILDKLSSTKYNYTNVTYTTFKKLYNKLFGNKQIDLLRNLFDILQDTNDVDKLLKIISNIIYVLLNCLISDNSKKGVLYKKKGGKKYFGGKINSKYIKFNNVYLQTCINIYLYETKNNGLMASSDKTSTSKDIEYKLQSIVTFIMRLYMNTLPYYLINLNYYDNTFNITQKPAILDKINSNLKEDNRIYYEDDIYKDIYDVLNNDPTTKLTVKDIEKKITDFCEEAYYKDISCNITDDKISIPNYLKRSKRKLFMGGTNDDDDDDNDKIYNLTQILFTNPYYLLNHVSMNLCLLNDFYKEIKTTIVDDTTFIKFNDSEKIIIKLYEKIEEIIENDII